MNDDSLVRLDEVRWMLAGVSKSAIRDWQRRGEFPRGIRLGKRTVRWRQSAIREFIARREAQTA